MEDEDHHSISPDDEISMWLAIHPPAAHTMASPSPLACPPLASVEAVILRVAPHVASQRWATALVSAFLDTTDGISLPTAAASGSLRLFDRIATRIDLDSATELRLRDWLWSNAMRAAIKNDDLAMVKHIHALHPEPLGVHSVGIAVRNGSIELVKWLVANRRDRMCRSTAGDDSLCQGCFKDYVYRMRRSCSRSTAKCIEVGAWCDERGLFDCLEEGKGYSYKLRCLDDGVEKMLHVIETGVDGDSPDRVLGMAMQKNDVDAVRFLLEGGYAQLEEEDADMVVNASLQNHEEVVEYVMSSSFADPFRHKLEYKAGFWFPVERTEEDFRALMRDAISVGNLDVARHLYEECGILPHGSVSNKKKTDDEALAIYQWMHSVGTTTYDALCMHHAVDKYWPTVVEWLCHHGAQRYCYTSPEQAAQNGQLRSLQLIHKWELQPIEGSVMTYAAIDGHLDIVQWLVTVMSYDDMWTHALACAVAFNRIEMAMWLRENGEDVCPACAIKTALCVALRMWDYTCCDGLRWLYGQGDLECDGDCVGQFDRYSDRIRPLSVDDAIASFAGTAGDLPLLEWLAHQTDKAAVDWNLAAENAATHGHLGVIQWIHEQVGVPLDLERVRAAAAEGKRVAEHGDYDDPAYERGVVHTQHIDEWFDHVEAAESKHVSLSDE